MKWIARLFGVVAGLVLLAVAALFVIPTERIADIAEQRFEAATGRALTVTGSVRPTLYPDLGVRLGAVEIANADWAGGGPMIAAEGIEVSVELMPLFQREIRVKGVLIDQPDILLQTAADGRTNWTFDGAAAADEGGAQAGTGSAGLPAFSLDQAVIRQGRLRYEDGGSGQSYELDGLAVETSIPDSRGMATLTLSALLNGQAFTLDAQIAALSGLLTGAQTGVDTRLTLGSNTIAFDGAAGLSPLALSGDLGATINDLGALTALTGQPRPDIPQGLGRDRILLQSVLTLGPEMDLALSGMTLMLDQNELAGNVAVSLAGKPFVNAVLDAGALDLAALTGGDGADLDADQAPGDGWSKQPIDASALGLLNADVTIDATSVDLGTTQLGRTQIRLTLNNSRLVTDIRELRSYGGLMTGQFVVNNRGGLSVGGDISASSVALQALFEDFLDFDRLQGSGDLNLSFLGSGNSLHAIMNSLGGSGRVDFGKGELLGVDLVGMLRNLDTSFRGEGARTVYDSISASFDITGGVINNVDLSFLSPLAEALGQGTIGLGQQTLDYRLTPRLLKGVAGEEGISVPVLITGSWSAPKFRPDLGGLLDRKLEEEKAALKARADAKLEEEKDRLEERARQKAREELNLQDGQSVKETLKDKADEELKRGLGRLFGRD